jgi:predicted ester cyclase
VCFGIAYYNAGLLSKEIAILALSIFPFIVIIQRMNNKEAEEMTPDREDSPIRYIIDRAFNQGDLAVVDELLTPNHFTHTTFGGATNGPQGLKWLVAILRTAFPDLHCTVEDEIRVGDKLAGHWTMRGTHKGLFMGNPPTGKEMQARGIIFARFEKELMVEYWMLIDQFGLLQQLGIIPR